MDRVAVSLPDVSRVSSPAILLYPERIRNNIQRMVEIAGGTSRLRPHIKTHKSAEIVRMQIEAGILKFKCATLAEAELLAREGSSDVLLAIQPVGPDIVRYVELSVRHPNTDFSVVVDDVGIIHELNSACESASVRLGVFLDLNVGMDRTGIKPGKEALVHYKLMHEMPFLDIRGLHVYDGHIHDGDLSERTERVEEAWSLAENFKEQLGRMGFAPPVIVAGGSPSFPIHAKREGVELSPGTTLLWDFGMLDLYEDLPFECAAFLLIRVVSKPAEGLVCFGLGHKAVAAEMNHPRVRILGLEDAEFVAQSEEHLVARIDDTEKFEVGDPFLAIPKHICPTMALYDHFNVVEKGEIVKGWKNAARHRL